jgi:hypothetical protein
MRRLVASLIFEAGSLGFGPSVSLRADQSLGLDRAARNNTFSAVGFAPFAVHIGHVWSETTDRNFQEALPFGGFEEDSFFFCQPMSHRSAANASLGR